MHMFSFTSPDSVDERSSTNEAMMCTITEFIDEQASAVHSQIQFEASATNKQQDKHDRQQTNNKLPYQCEQQQQTTTTCTTNNWQSVLMVIFMGEFQKCS